MTFVSPILLIGLIAAGIPFLLHLISRVRAQQEAFPTLRFLRISMEKNAHRRRLQNWLLLLLRSVLLALLAMAVAEPISRAASLGLASSGQVAAIVLDNSYSMEAKVDKSSASRFDLAKSGAAALLGNEGKPALATMMTTVGPSSPQPISGQLDTVRKSIAAAKIQYSSASLSQRFTQACKMLNKQSNPNRAIYIFSDLQQLSFDPVTKLPDLTAAKNFQIFIINCAPPAINNVGITNLAVGGKTVVDGRVEFVATIQNSSPAERRVEVEFFLEGKIARTAQGGQVAQGPRLVKKLAPAGQPGDSAQVKFTHQFSRAENAVGQLRLRQADDLMVDNVRKFRVKIKPRAMVLIVTGPGETSGALRPGAMLELALDWRDSTQQQIPWPIQLKTTTAAKFSPASLKNINTVFFCEVPTFDTAASRAIGDFVAGGGQAVFFLGPEVQPDNYNKRFGKIGTGLLPGTLGKALGQIGPEAHALAIEALDTKHPLLAGLFDDPADYPTVLIQRYFAIKADSPAVATALMKFPGGEPLLIEKKINSGSALWCMTTASPRWSNLPTTSLFLPMMLRLALQSGQSSADTSENSATNPFGPESNLQPVKPETLTKILNNAGLERVYVGPNLGAVRAMAKTNAQGHNWWAALTVTTILVLLIEAIIANRRRNQAQS